MASIARARVLLALSKEWVGPGIQVAIDIIFRLLSKPFKSEESLEECPDGTVGGDAMLTKPEGEGDVCQKSWKAQIISNLILQPIQSSIHDVLYQYVKSITILSLLKSGETGIREACIKILAEKALTAAFSALQRACLGLFQSRRLTPILAYGGDERPGAWDHCLESVSANDVDNYEDMTDTIATTQNLNTNFSMRHASQLQHRWASPSTHNTVTLRPSSTCLTQNMRPLALQHPLARQHYHSTSQTRTCLFSTKPAAAERSYSTILTHQKLDTILEDDNNSVAATSRSIKPRRGTPVEEVDAMTGIVTAEYISMAAAARSIDPFSKSKITYHLGKSNLFFQDGFYLRKKGYPDPLLSTKVEAVSLVTGKEQPWYESARAAADDSTTNTTLFDIYNVMFKKQRSCRQGFYWREHESDTYPGRQKAGADKPFYCYLLVSISEDPRYKGKTYVGYTECPKSRLEKHNGGSIDGGAKATSIGGPWRLVVVVSRFGESNAPLEEKEKGKKKAAFDFEQEWQRRAFAAESFRRGRKDDLSNLAVMEQLSILYVFTCCDPKNEHLAIDFLKQSDMTVFDEVVNVPVVRAHQMSMYS